MALCTDCFSHTGLLDTHPGLDFLKAAPEFQQRYGRCTGSPVRRLVPLLGVSGRAEAS